MSFTQRNLCPGCIQNQPNQVAHMHPGGCLYTDDDEISWESDSSEAGDADSSDEFEPENLAPLNLEPAFEQAFNEAVEEPKPKIDVSKPLVEPLFDLPSNFHFDPCAICFEKIEMVNVTITTCGHAFHSSCAFKALENNDCCPMCRHQLVDAPVEDDDSEGEYEESVDEEGSDAEDDASEEEDVKVNLEQLAGKLQNMGYTMADILKFFVSDVKSGTNEQKYDEQYIDKMENDINGVIEGTISLAHRDARSYAAVVAAPKPHPQQAQQAQQPQQA